MYPKRPQADIAELGSTWHLHPFLVENLLHAGQRPKLERYGDTPFFVIRSAWHVDDAEDVNFAEFHTLVRPRSVAVFCQDGRRIDVVDAVADGFTPLLRCGTRCGKSEWKYQTRGASPFVYPPVIVRRLH